MALASLFQDLGGDVVRSTTQRRPADGLHILASYKQSRKPKITNLCVHMPVEEDVTHFQVPMDNSFGVHVFYGTGNLHGIETDLGLGDTLPAPDHVHQRAIGTQLQYKIGTIIEGEGSQKLDNVVVPHLGVDLELGLELKENVKSQVYGTDN